MTSLKAPSPLVTSDLGYLLFIVLKKNVCNTHLYVLVVSLAKITTYDSDLGIMIASKTNDKWIIVFSLLVSGVKGKCMTEAFIIHFTASIQPK